MIFLPIAVFFYYMAPQKFKSLYLLAISYYFYCCFALRAVPFLLCATVVSYFAALAIEKSDGNKRRNIMLLALLINIGMLLVFKYFNFFSENLISLANAFGAQLVFKKFDLITVAGISFFTFQTVGYLCDVYLKNITAERNILVYSLFVSFFPHIYAGPIARAGKLLPQFYTQHNFEYPKIVSGLQLMAIGFFKKIAVADVLAMFINTVHGDLPSYPGSVLILTAFTYSVQLYCDFSGYSDIARGSARLLGFELMENFNTPYLSTSFSQFWTRWHISLSSWFQDYIFTPFVWTNPLKALGKTFVKPPIIIGIWLVFLTSGLWHGSAFTFIIWGALHAVYRTGEDLMRKYYKKPDKKPSPIKFWAKAAWVFTLVTFSQIFFRASSLQDAFYYVRHLFSDLSIIGFKNGIYLGVAGGFDKTLILIYAYIAYCILAVTMVVFMDCYRYFKLKGKCMTTAFLTLRQPYRLLMYYLLIGFILAGFIMQNGGYGSSPSLIYGGF